MAYAGIVASHPPTLYVIVKLITEERSSWHPFDLDEVLVREDEYAPLFVPMLLAYHDRRSERQRISFMRSLPAPRLVRWRIRSQ